MKEGNIIKVRGRHKCPCGCFCSGSCSSSFLRVFTQVINRKVEQKKKKSNLKNKTSGNEREVCMKPSDSFTCLTDCSRTAFDCWPGLEEGRWRQSLSLKSGGCHLPVLETLAGGLVASAGPRFLG